jgi:hypothetical protein
MSTSREKITMARGAPDLLSDHFVLPSKKNKVSQIRPPQGVDKKQRRSPSPRKKSSVSRKKLEVSGSDSTRASPFDIPRPFTINYVHGDGAAKTTESQPGHVKGRAEWSNLSCSPSKIASETSVFDVYAPSYVPLWLRAVNESIAVPRFCSSLQTINFPEYINNFAGSQYLQPLASVNPPAIQTVPIVHSIAPESLSSKNYAAYFWEALQNEVSAEAADLRSCNIFAAAFEVQDHVRQLFRVKVPGLRENSPRIDLGDVVLVRPLFHQSDAPELTTSWCAPGGGRERGLCPPAFVGLEFHAIVWGVARAKEEILLRVDGLTSLSCNIIFAVQEHRITPIARSVTAIAESLRAPRSAPITSDWLYRMLFPTSSDCVVQLTLPKGIFPDIKWFDTQLNYE